MKNRLQQEYDILKTFLMSINVVGSTAFRPYSVVANYCAQIDVVNCVWMHSFKFTEAYNFYSRGTPSSIRENCS
jgi:hypothetical protein